MRICVCGRELAGWRLWVVVVAGTAGGVGLVVWTASGWSRAAAWLLAVWGAGLVLAVVDAAVRRLRAPGPGTFGPGRVRGGVAYGGGRGKQVDGGAVLGRTPGEGAQS